MKNKISTIELFSASKSTNRYLKVSAPMVRYSKVQFRTLVRHFGADLCFTPMILADSFCQNSKARSSEFATTINDTPLIVQFAANSVGNFVDASQLVYEYADGVDLNCGCPQRWAMNDGYGSSLLKKPEIICDLVCGVKRNLPEEFTVSVKIRISSDLNKSVDICRQIESSGADFLTVHGRTPSQKCAGDINVAFLSHIKDSIQIPIIANGGVKSLQEADDLQMMVQCDGIMVANALLTNPALFSGANKTPLSCVKFWMSLKNRDKDKISFQCYHHHLVFMLDKIISKQEKCFFNSLSTFEDVDDYLYNNVLSTCNSLDTCASDEFVDCVYDETITSKHSSKCRDCGKSYCYCQCKKYESSKTDGSYFSSYKKNIECDLDYMESNIFDEN